MRPAHLCGSRGLAPPGALAPTFDPSDELIEELNAKHAAPKYARTEDPLWLLTVKGVGRAGLSWAIFCKAVGWKLHTGIVKKVVPRHEDVCQIAVQPRFWGVVVEVAKSRGWETIADVPPWEPVPGETLTAEEARAKGRMLWGTEDGAIDPLVRRYMQM
ncbi:hypothetical protein IWQ57_003637, partial [Coemansia nantahalensis]